MKLKEIIAGSPALVELLAGWQSVRAEVRRVLARVRLQRELTNLDREEERAVHEVEWRQHELTQAAQNLALLQVRYENRRTVLRRRLHATRLEAVDAVA